MYLNRLFMLQSYFPWRYSVKNLLTFMTNFNNMKFLLFILLISISHSSFSQEKTIKYYKKYKLNNEVPEEKADISITTIVEEGITTVEWKYLKNKKVYTRTIHDEDDIPIGVWIENGKEVDYNFVLEPVPDEIVSTIQKLEPSKNMEVRKDTQRIYRIPRSFLNREASTGGEWSSIYVVIIKNGELKCVYLKESSGEKLLDKNGAKTFMSQNFKSLLGKDATITFEMPITVTIR